MGGDRLVVARDAMGGSRDDGRDLQRGPRRIGARPERRAGPVTRSGRANGTPPSGRVAPASQSHSARAARRARRGGVGERLERVERAAGLALGRAQVGLEAVAVPAVVVGVGLDGVEDALGRLVAEQDAEAPAVEHARVPGHEGGGCGDVGHPRSQARRSDQLLDVSAIGGVADQCRVAADPVLDDHARRQAAQAARVTGQVGLVRVPGLGGEPRQAARAAAAVDEGQKALQPQDALPAPSAPGPAYRARAGAAGAPTRRLPGGVLDARADASETDGVADRSDPARSSIRSAAPRSPSAARTSSSAARPPTTSSSRTTRSRSSAAGTHRTAPTAPARRRSPRTRVPPGRSTSSRRAVGPTSSTTSSSTTTSAQPSGRTSWRCAVPRGTISVQRAASWVHRGPKARSV